MFYQNTHYKAISLPYKGNNLSMIVVLPEINLGIKGLLQNIKFENLYDMGIKMEKKEVNLRLP